MKRTVRVTCEFEFDITQSGIDDGAYGEEATTFDEALEATRGFVKSGKCSLLGLVEGGISTWTMEFVQEYKGVPAIRRIEGYNPIGV